MENDGGARWRFKVNDALSGAATVSIRGVLNNIMSYLDAAGRSHVIPLGHGDPSAFPCFRTTEVAEEAIVEAVRSAKYNCTLLRREGMASCDSAIAEHLSRDLPYKLFPNDVFLTSGCNQATGAIISVLASPGANILLPEPGYPFYQAQATFSGLEYRHFSLIPERGWEIDLDAVEALADENTVAMVIINPGNPCGNVFTYQHLAKVAVSAKTLGIRIIADEVYGHLTFGSKPFVPMGVFGKTTPILTLGSISKRWAVPGWRMGWLLTSDSNGILKETKIVLGIENYLNISTNPATFIQAAVPNILENTKDDFFNKTISILSQAADICYAKLEEIDCITCPRKPEGSMSVMVELSLSYLEDIFYDVDFCCKLAKEESVIILRGSVVGLKNWLRITFAIDPSSLEDGLARLKSFCERHKKQVK